MLCVNVGEECLTVVRVLFSFLVEKYRSHAAALHVILFVFHMFVCEQFVSSILRIQSVTAVLVSEPEPNFLREQEHTHFDSHVRYPLPQCFPLSWCHLQPCMFLLQVFQRGSYD